MVEHNVDDLLDKLNWAISNYKEEHTSEQWESINQLPIKYPELVHMAGDLGEYPLHKAAKHGCGFAIQRLLEAGARVDELTEDGRLPLHLAAAQGQADACQQLVEAGSDLTRRSFDGFTPLVEAIYHNKYETVGQLLALGAPMDLRAAVCLRQATIIRLMLRENPELIRVGLDAADLLAEASLYLNGVDVIRLLLEAGADPNNPKVLRHSLKEAMDWGNSDTVALLLRYGADPDWKAKSGDATPREYAEARMLGWALDLFSRATLKPST